MFEHIQTQKYKMNWQKFSVCSNQNKIVGHEAGNAP